MPYCSVFGCKNNSKYNDSRVKFYRFPVSTEHCEKWIKACKQNKNINLKTARVCSAHFHDSFRKRNEVKNNLGYGFKYERDLKDDAVPTENLPNATDNNEYRQHCSSAEIGLDDTINSNQSIPRDIVLENADSAPLIGNLLGPHEVEMLQKRIEELENENNKLKKENSSFLANNILLESQKRELFEELQSVVKNNKQHVHTAVSSVLSSLFTPGQINQILNKPKKLKWSREDISAAISLRSVSPKAYRYLRNKLHYPLPDLSTLRRWASTLSMNEGFLFDVFSLMKSMTNTLKSIEKIVSLSFDEIHLSNRIEFDSKNEEAIGPCESAQVMVVRSLFGRWKQPIYYSYDQNMTKDILMTAVCHLHECGYNVVAVTCDMGGSNIAVWKELGITSPDEPFFLHPKTSEKIYFFADVPHLVKLLRNHFLDQGFAHENGVIMNKKPLEDLIKLCSNSDLKTAHKLTQNHLDVKGVQRQRVKLAVQIFSNSVAKALTLCKNENLLNTEEKLDELIELIQLTNDWFDVFNSKLKYGKHEGVHAFGMKLEHQIDTIQKMTNYIRSIRVVGRKSMLPFQKGIILSNNSLIGLFADLRNKYKIGYLRTYKLNQDVIENLFGYIRAMGSTKDHPSGLDLRYRLRWYILGKHSEGIFFVNQNNEDDAEAFNLTTMTRNDTSQCGDDDFTTTGKILRNLQNPSSTTSSAKEEDDLNFDWDFSNNDNIVSTEGLKYVVGSVCHKFRNKFPHLGSRDSNQAIHSEWIDLLNKGGLVYPSKEFFDIGLKMEESFNEVHGSLIKKGRGIVGGVLKIMMEKHVIDETLYPNEVFNCSC